MTDYPKNIYAAILAGGRGIRFWPLSRFEEPKQLLKIFGKHSLLQRTFLRVSKIIKPSNIYIVTNRDYANTIKYQLEEIGFQSNNIIVEISPKNTAASIGLVAKIIKEKDKDGVLAIFPSDHFIENDGKFLYAIKMAYPIAQSGLIVIFGIKPQRIEVAYGYIKVNKKFYAKKHMAFKVQKFIEKPNKIYATKLIKDSNVYWNGGIFVCNVSVLLDQIQNFMPQLYAVLNERNSRLFRYKWDKLTPVSIDYGILEKCKRNLFVIPLDCGWTDLGNWSTLDFVLNRDKYGNAIYGDVLAIKTNNTTIWGGHHLIAAIGLKNMIIADTPDALLVCPKEEAQKVSEIVEILKTKKRFEYTTPRLVNRPWGRYLVLSDSGKFKTKIVEIEPHKCLSLQLHQKRAEHWVVVEGTAKVIIGRKIYYVKSNESIFVPRGHKHRVENPENKRLTFIEVQTGSYLGEDDIKRFQDDYERK